MIRTDSVNQLSSFKSPTRRQWLTEHRCLSLFKTRLKAQTALALVVGISDPQRSTKGVQFLFCLGHLPSNFTLTLTP